MKGRIARATGLGRARERRRVERMRIQAERALDGRSDAGDLRGVLHRLAEPPTDPAAVQWTGRIEEQRSKLLASHRQLTEVITTQDGAVRDGPTLPVSEVCAKASKDRGSCSMLFDLVRALRPKLVLEMGTCLGVSGAYLAAALDVNGEGGRLVTIEGQPSRVEVARELFAAVGLSDVDVIEGRFDDVLPLVLDRPGPQVDLAFIDGWHKEEPTMRYFDRIAARAAPGAVLLFDDITWNDGMKRAWAQIQADERVDLAIDLRSMGLVRLRG